MKKYLIVLIVACAGGGCATLSIVPPEVTLVDLEFTDLTMFETTGEFTVRLANENPDPLRINGGVFRLYLNGVKVGKALTSESVEVPRLGTATQRVALHVNNVALISRLASLLEEPVLDYQIKTRLFVEGAYGTRRVNFENAGTFSWDQQETEPLVESEVDG
ncbi:MAG: LEA type 2 family protein [bacterium]|nr:LEA type 2 family protein [bacterium]